MNIDEQAEDLGVKMSALLSYAHTLMPGSMICIFSFTRAEADRRIRLDKISTNHDNPEVVADCVADVLQAMLDNKEDFTIKKGRRLQ